MLFKIKISKALTITDCKVQPNFKVKVVFVYQNQYEAECIYGWGNDEYSTFSVNATMPIEISREIEELINNEHRHNIKAYLDMKIKYFEERSKNKI